jgi:DNA-binding GntR family transcriptional regulator
METGASRRTVRRALDELIAEDAIYFDGPKSKGTYRLKK